MPNHEEIQTTMGVDYLKAKFSHKIPGLSFPDHICVFIDESGELGFTPKASKFFIVSYVIPYEQRILETDLKRLRRKIQQRQQFTGEEFKFSHDSEEIRSKVVGILQRHKLDMGLGVVEKQFVEQHLRNKPAILYNYLVVNYVIPELLLKYSPSHIRFVVDKRLNKKAREAFNFYFRNKLNWPV